MAVIHNGKNTILATQRTANVELEMLSSVRVNMIRVCRVNAVGEN